jgi:hypothetical protein
MLTPTARNLTFVGLCVSVVLFSAGYTVFSRRAAPPASAAPTVADPAVIADAVSRPHLLVRSTALDATYGQVSVVPLDRDLRLDGEPDARVTTPLFCERVYAAAGHGVCLAADRGVITSYRAEVFDTQFQARTQLPITGVPSRTRVAPDGSLAAFTYFVSGDSYAAGGFSTRTVVIDTADGSEIVQLEQLAVTRDGTAFKAVDFNFWGVTFARQPGRLYATLATGGVNYLIEADARARTARVLRDGVECPSLSPDNRRVAFKRRMPGIRLHWRIYVLDLESGRETPLAESRSVDDQVEWLDDSTILYALPSGLQKARASMDVWAVPADGSGSPRLLIENADSPAVVRP